MRCRQVIVLLGILLAGAATGCGGGGSADPVPVGPPSPTELVGLSASQHLIRFRTSDPATILSSVPVTGLPSGETLLAVAYGQVGAPPWILYGLGSDSRIYALDELSGGTTPVGSAAFSPALNGTSFGMVFEYRAAGGPHVHVLSDTGQHLLVSIATGAVADAGAVGWAGGGGGAAPAVVAVAYWPSPSSYVGLERTRGIRVALDLTSHVAIEQADAGIVVAPDASLTVLYSHFNPVALATGGGAVPPRARAYVTSTPAASPTSRLYYCPEWGSAFEDLGTVGGGAVILGLAGHDDY